MTKFRPAAALAATALITAVTLSACGTGQSWVTEGLDPSGNGTYTTVGSLQAQNLTLVQGPSGSKSVALVGSFINGGDSADAITGATLGTDTAGTVANGKIELPPRGALTTVGFGEGAPTISFFNTDVPTAHYQNITLTFAAAGQKQVSVLVVPATGYYSSVTPGPLPK